MTNQSTSSDCDLAEVVLTYMTEQNRPHNAKNACLNIKMSHGITASQSAYDKLLNEMSIDSTSDDPKDAEHPLVKLVNGTW